MALLEVPRLSPRALLLAAVALLGACSSTAPSRLVLGDLSIDNTLSHPVVFRAVWTDEPTGVHVLLEGMLPAAGGKTRFEQQAGVPAGVALHFAVEGEGCADTLARAGLPIQSLLPLAADPESWQESGFLLRSSGTEPRAVGPLEPAQARWTSSGEEERLVLRSSEGGGIRVERR